MKTVDPAQFDSYDEYVEYMQYVKRMKALKVSKENIKRDAEGYRATSGMSKGQQFLAGMGAETMDLGRRNLNRIGVKGIGGFDTSDEALAEQERLDRDLNATGAGQAGRLAGGILATAPIGMGVGSAATGVLRGLNMANRTGRLAKALTAASELGNTGRGLGRITRGVTEGASQGVLTSRKGEELEGGLMGGAVGGLFPTVGAAGRRMTKALARDKMLPQARTLQGDMDVTSYGLGYVGDEAPMIPASQALKPGGLKQLYEGFVANMPFSGPRLRGQYDQAVEGFRETAIRHATPDGVNPATIFQQGDDIPRSLKALKGAWDDTFQPINDMPIRVRHDFWDKDLADEIYRRYEIRLPTGKLKGKDLTNAKTDLNRAMKALAKDDRLGRVKREKILNEINKVEQHIASKLHPDDAAKWFDDLKKYRNYQILKKAAGATGGTSEFLPKAIAAKAARMAGDAGVFGEGGIMQDIGREGIKALRDFTSRPGVFQTLAATGAAGGIGGALTGAFTDQGAVKGGLSGAMLGLAGPIALSRGLSNRYVQRKIMDGIKSPDKLRQLFTMFPELNQVLRRGAAGAAIQDQKQEQSYAP